MEQDPFVDFLCAKHDRKKADMECSEQHMIEIDIGNKVERIQTESKNQFEWTCFVNVLSFLHEIKSVTFVLHPTFSPSTIKITQPPYEITRSGWGEFEITIIVECTQLPPQTFTHNLNLSENNSISRGINVPATETLPIPDDELRGKRVKELKEILLQLGGSIPQGAIQKSELIQLITDLGTPTLMVRRMTDIETVPPRTMHGSLFQSHWKAPILQVECAEEARPGYNSMMAHEYEDDPRTLDLKIQVLARLLQDSNAACAYTGAGISTSSGIDDYASKAKNSKMKQGRKKVKSGFLAEPSLGHRVLAQLCESGLLQHWIQQNHDGLPQKAGFPQHMINEIHGAWYDPSNPVVPMSGSLRDDLYSWMHEWEEKTDLTLAMGTSLCGMNADRMVESPSRRKINQNEGYGSVIVGLQRTILDEVCSLRIFATIDTVVALLSRQLGFVIKPYTKYVPNIPQECIVKEHVYRVPYDSDGNLTTNQDEMICWDLRSQAKIKVTDGPGTGYKGDVLGNNDPISMHYTLRIPLQREGHKNQGKTLSRYRLGGWWIECCVNGLWPKLPVVNAKPIMQNTL